MATHVGVLDHGKLVQFGSPREIYEDPVSIYAASRLGSPKINVLPADLFPGAPAGAASIGLRSEHIRLGEGHEAQAVRVEYLGDQTRLHLKIKDLNLITLIESHIHIQPGDRLKISPQSPLYFDASGERIKS